MLYRNTLADIINELMMNKKIGHFCKILTPFIRNDYYLNIPRQNFSNIKNIEMADHKNDFKLTINNECEKNLSNSLNSIGTNINQKTIHDADTQSIKLLHDNLIKDNLDCINSKLSNLANQYYDTQSILNTLSNQCVPGISTSLNNIDSKIVSLENTIADMSEIQSKITSLENAIANMSEIQSKIVSLENTIADMSERQSQFSHVQTKIKNLEDNIDNLPINITIFFLMLAATFITITFW